MYNAMTREGLYKIREGIDLLINALNDKEKNQVKTNYDAVKVAEPEREVATPTAPDESVKTEPKKEVASFDRDDLNSMAYNDLKKLAKDLGVSGAGARDKIIERILDIDLTVGNDGDIEVASEQQVDELIKTETTAKAPKGIKKIGKKSVEPEQPEETDPLYEKVLATTEDMSLEELGDVLSDIGLSPKGKRQALIDKIYAAVKDGQLSFDDEEEDDTEEQSEPVTADDEGEEYDGVNDPDNMTDARKEACEKYADQITADFKNGELSEGDIKDFCLEFYGEENADEINALSGDGLIELYIDAVLRMIDDDGELVEEGAYTVNGEYFCCGRQLKYAEDTGKYICEMCGEEYDAE